MPGVIAEDVPQERQRRVNGSAVILVDALFSEPALTSFKNVQLSPWSTGRETAISFDSCMS